MRFQKCVHYPHPPRGPGRRPYHVSEAARRARRQNLSKTRIRSSREILTIKRWIWQDTFGDGPHLSQRELARQLGVCPSYIHKVQHQRAEAIDALTSGQRVALDDLLAAQRFTARLREHEPGLLAPVAESSHPEEPRGSSKDDEIIAKNRREIAEWKRKHLHYGGRGWFRW